MSSHRRFPPLLRGRTLPVGRRGLLLGAAAVLAGGCAPRARLWQRGYLELASAGPAPASKGNVLVFMPETSQTREVWTGLNDELREEFRLTAVRIENAASVADIAEGMRRHRPSGVVLMNNPTVAAYREYQRASGGQEFPPAIIVMTSFLDGHAPKVIGATGISYEVPLITVVTNLRKLVPRPIDRVGVIVRAPLRGFVERQAALASREKIAVVEESVSAEPNSSELKWALRRIKQRSQAIWVLNDNQLLTPELISDGWMPGLNERPWVPAIVGAASLVSPAHSFGTFAVLPDHTALGAQVASLVFELSDNDWRLAENRVELPVSTTTSIDLVQARERFQLRGDALQQVDQILE